MIAFCAALSAVCLLSCSLVGLYAATSLNFGGNSVLTSRPMTEEEEIFYENKEVLDNGGFNFGHDEFGNAIIMQGFDYDKDTFETVNLAHNTLVGKDENGVKIQDAPVLLRYVKMVNTICQKEDGIITAVLDLSNTNIGGFGENWLRDMFMIFIGSNSFSGSQGKKWTEDLTTFDAAKGEILTGKKDVTIELPTDINKSFAVRVILPNYAMTQGRHLRFLENSLTFRTGISVGNIDSKPGVISFDLTQLTGLHESAENPKDVEGLEFSLNAAIETNHHYHMVVRDDHAMQQRFALQNALDYTFGAESYSTNELYYQLGDTAMTQIRNRASHGADGDSLVMYGEPNPNPAVMTANDKTNLLRGCKFLSDYRDQYLAKANFLFFATRDSGNVASAPLAVTVVRSGDQAGNVSWGTTPVGNFLTDLGT